MQAPEAPGHGDSGPVAALVGGLGLLAVVGLVVVVPLLCLGVLLLSPAAAGRREADLHRDLQEQRQTSSGGSSGSPSASSGSTPRRDGRSTRQPARGPRAELADLEEERRRVLERVAAPHRRARPGTSWSPTIEHDARRHAARAGPRHRARGAARRPRRAPGGSLATVDPAARLRADRRVDRRRSCSCPSDDMKGRIIGREGRNIRAFEQITGVNLVIDDTPEAVLLSCFDPVRREVGRLTLEALIGDGRIHPSRIEEVARAGRRPRSSALCLRAGEDACLEMGITDLHPELVATLGRLQLPHVVRPERAHATSSSPVTPPACSPTSSASTGAAACGAAFLHDIGKALTHEVEGSHAIVGADLARRYGEHEDVVHAIEAHHNEVEPRTVEAVLTQAADAISGGRPGARRESLEAYVNRLHRLEEIALAKPGVDKVFAMQAGRDVRVMVLPDVVDDIAGPGARPRHRQAVRGGADLPGADQGHRHPGVPRHRGRPLSPPHSAGSGPSGAWRRHDRWTAVRCCSGSAAASLHSATLLSV